MKSSSRSTPSDARAPAGLLILPYALLLLISFPALLDLVNDWVNDPNYSHGFLVPIVSAALIWSKRKRFAELPAAPDRRGLIPIIIGVVLFILANGAAEYFTLRVSIVVLLFGLTCYLFGAEVIRVTWFAFFFLVFMIPIPYVVYYAATFPMQTLATKITVVVLDNLGMNAVRQGNIIHITGQSLEVAEACSGIRSLVSLLALGAVYAYVTQKRLPAQGILFCATVPIAVVGNVFRVLTTAIIVATVTDEVTEEPLHSIMGLSVFAVAFVLLTILAAVLKRMFK